MKAETKLNKILAMEDSNSKATRLFSFCMQLGIQHTFWQNKAKQELSRLTDSGYTICFAGMK